MYQHTLGSPCVSKKTNSESKMAPVGYSLTLGVGMATFEFIAGAHPLNH